MRVAVTGARGRLGRALVEALEDAPFTGPRGPIAWSRPELDLDTLTPESVAALIDARPPGARHPRRRLDRRRRLRPRPRARHAAQRRRPPARRARPAPIAGVAPALVSTNEVFDGARTDGRGYAPGRPAARDQPLRPRASSRAEELVERSGLAASWTAAFAIVAHLLAPRPAGQRLPGQDRRAPRSRAKAAGEPLKAVARRDRPPDLHAGRRRRRRRADLGGRPARRHGPATSTTSSTPAARPAPTGRARSSGRRASTSRSRRSRQRPGRARAPRPAGPSSSRRRSRPASRCATGASRFAHAVPALGGGSREPADRPAAI